VDGWKLTLQIEAESPDRFPQHVLRIVSENARTLKFRNQRFEPD
jgi:hypothetical protein